MREAILCHGAEFEPPIRDEDLRDAASLLALAERAGCEQPERNAGHAGKLLADVFEAVVEPKLLDPIADTDHLEVLPRVSQHRQRQGESGDGGHEERPMPLAVHFTDELLVADPLVDEVMVKTHLNPPSPEP